ncbi:unnamed protein product [Callosobruchus maculatus]|uniref:Regulatory protein zeste n=1 Tax=Callosobruchus maculatus TaxID=64391 RepID=A0A653CLY6_CALMS|nr:unnamed protein product [Callosobruchus maculatus]
MEKLPKKRRRRSNFSQEEIERLISLVKKRRSIIENKRNDAAIWVEKEAAWKEVEKEFNCTSGRELRDAKQLRFKYDALRRLIRKKIENSRECYSKSDSSSTSPTPTLTSAEKKLLDSILLPTDSENDCHPDQVMDMDYHTTTNKCGSCKVDAVDAENTSTETTAGLDLQDEVDIKPIVVLEKGGEY